MANHRGHNPETLLTELADASVHGARRIAFAQGWRRLVLSAAAGMMVGLAFPPFYAIPGILVGLTLLIWLIDGLDDGWKGSLDALTVGGTFGIGNFSVALHWFWFFGSTPSVAITLDGIVLLAWASALTALAVLSAHRFWSAGPERGLTLAVCLTVSEWCRATLFGGLPFGLVGSIWAENVHMIQISAWVGVYGLSLFTLVIGTAVAGSLPNPSFTHHGSSQKSQMTLWWSAVACGVLLLIFLIGVWRLSEEAEQPTHTTYLRVISASEGVCDLDPAELQGDPSFGDKSVTYSDVSMLIVPGPSCDIRFLSEHTGGTEIVSAWIKDNQVAVVQSARRARPVGAYDSVHVIGAAGDIRATHDRSQGLSFGLGPIGPVTGGELIALGKGPRTIAPSDVPEFGVMVGADVVTSGAVVDDTRRPDWLLSLSDDKRTIWGAQKAYLDAARLRAVEEGLPVVRGSAGGVSVVFDAYGREVSRSDLQGLGVFDVALPAPLVPTIFAQIGNQAIFLALMITALLAYGLSRWRVPTVRAA